MSQPIPSEVNGELIRAAFDRCPAGLVVIDAMGSIVVINDELERMLGYRRDELVGQNVDILVPTRYAHGHALHREAFLVSASARRMGAGREVSARHRDGREIPVEVGLSTIDTRDGTFVLSTLVDVTERRRIEERLRQTHRLEAVGTLASGIAHDFNNILQGIIGYTELVRESAIDNPSQLADLGVVLDTAKRGRNLVKRILSFTRQAEPNRTATHLSQPMGEALRLLETMLPHGVKVRQSCDPATPAVVADATEIHQIVTNLSTNAAYAMKDCGGILEVRTGPVTIDRSMVTVHPELSLGLYAYICVSDSGIGIPADKLQRIFDPFYTTKPVGEGTGLGLSVTSRIVRALGGSVQVKSEVGVGTSFEVFLPAAVTSEVSNDSPSPNAAPHRCVLHVEDEVHLARLGKRILESVNFEVVTHTSSLEALEAFRLAPQRFDLVVTDNTMPNMTGLELVARLLEIRPDLPILMVSGIGDNMSIDELKKHGIRRLLSKPYIAAELRNAALELSTPASDRPDSR